MGKKRGLPGKSHAGGKKQKGVSNTVMPPGKPYTTLTAVAHSKNKTKNNKKSSQKKLVMEEPNISADDDDEDDDDKDSENGTEMDANQKMESSDNESESADSDNVEDMPKSKYVAIKKAAVASDDCHSAALRGAPIDSIACDTHLTCRFLE